MHKTETCTLKRCTKSAYPCTVPDHKNIGGKKHPLKVSSTVSGQARWHCAVLSLYALHLRRQHLQLLAITVLRRLAQGCHRNVKRGTRWSCDHPQPVTRRRGSPTGCHAQSTLTDRRLPPELFASSRNLLRTSAGARCAMESCEFRNAVPVRETFPNGSSFA